jgi:hypothetical protein
MAGRMINGAAALAELIRPASGSDEPGVHRVLPVLPELSGLLPSRGLRRGSTVAVATGGSAPGSGGTSLLLALLSAASQSGSWCAVVGVPALGALAAAESGIALDRLALVPNPGPDWPTVVAALIDGVDVVVVAVPGPVSASIASRLVARNRQRGSVLIPFGHWAGADVTLQVSHGRWEGLGAGRGRLRRREVTITARGRGAAARPREVTLWLPGVTTMPPPDPSSALPSLHLPSTATPAPTPTAPTPTAPTPTVPTPTVPTPTVPTPTVPTPTVPTPTVPTPTPASARASTPAPASARAPNPTPTSARPSASARAFAPVAPVVTLVPASASGARRRRSPLSAVC